MIVDICATKGVNKVVYKGKKGVIISAKWRDINVGLNIGVNMVQTLVCKLSQYCCKHMCTHMFTYKC